MLLITLLQLSFKTVDALQEFNVNTIYVDSEKITYPLTLRPWKQGDWFIPFGMQGKKKLSKYLKDQKVDMFSKQQVRVLCSDTAIIWVVGLRADNRFSVKESTKSILKISLH